MHLILFITKPRMPDGVRQQALRGRKVTTAMSTDTAERGCARGQQVRGRVQMAVHGGFLRFARVFGGSSGSRGPCLVQSMSGIVKTLY